MLRVKNMLLIIVAVSFLIISFESFLFAAPTTHPPKPDPAVMMADFFVARPIGFASLIIGSVSFVVSWPFSALGDNSQEAYNLMIVDPAVYTFKRPLGGF